ncbi:hypothetical protein C0995_011104 [Termitomyces sp. Mi166|nr:hypothetical protein C0995_011104 [Termitomyces sp. Mi166\
MDGECASWSWSWVDRDPGPSTSAQPSKAHRAPKKEDGGTGKDVRLAYDADSDEDDKPLSSLMIQPLRKLPVPPVQTAPAPAPAPPVIKIKPAKIDAPKSMYREREQATSPKPSLSSSGTTPPMAMPAPIPVAPLQPSWLPVRSLPKDGAAVLAPLGSLAMPTPRVASSHEHEPALAEPPRIGIEETGRASPGRYVHGTPLHNVMEEEEEE